MDFPSIRDGEVPLLETIASSVILAGIWSLTYIAYKHPAAYAKHWQPLALTTFGITFLGLTLWNTAVEAVVNQLYPIIPLANLDEARKLAGELSVPDWVSMLALGLCGYAVALLALPRLLEVDDDAETAN